MIIKNKCICPISLPKVTGTTARILRCGWCPNCLRQKKNELVVRTVREVEGKRIAFLTFTYRPEDCPIQTTEYIVDKDTGEYKERKSILRDKDKLFHRLAPFVWKTNKNGKRSRRFQPIMQETDFGFRYKYYTLYYDDFQKMLKRYRIKHPDTLKTFISVGEYGALTYRPHYHMLVVGLNESQINDLVSEWKYGEVYIDLCNNPKKPNDPKKIASYVAKYCNKGKYDCPYISQGKCIKPRRNSSINFGLGSQEQFKELRNNLLGGEFCHCPDPWLTDDLPLSDKQLKYMASQRHYLINDYSYPMPKYLINKVFKKTYKSVEYYDSANNRCVAIYECPCSDAVKSRIKELRKQGKIIKISYHQVSSPVQKQVARVILAELVSDAMRQQEQDKRLYAVCGKDTFDFSDTQNDEKNTLKDFEESFLSDLERNTLY